MNKKQFNVANENEKTYSRDDMKSFGLWLGNSLKKHKGRSIDELFDDFIKENL